MPEKVSMSEIANRLGLSKNTVSLAMRGIPSISEKTRKLVMETANLMGYKYKSSEQKYKSTRNLCLVIPRSTRESIGFFSYIQLGIEDEAKRNNMNTILHYYDENDKEFDMPLCIREGMISGIITLGRVSSRTISTIKSYGIPTVMVDHYFDDLEMDCVLTDNHSGCFTATEYLIRNGHREIGFCGDISASISFYDRYSGFLKALDSFGLKYDNSLSMIDTNLEKLAENDISVAANVMKAQKRLPSAFVCCNDIEAIVLCKALNYIGLATPGDISIIGFDDIELSRNVTPELTTMKVPKELMGKLAVQRLIAKLDNIESATIKLLISAELVERNSVTAAQCKG
jgi:LacI family transcriptional regulator